jgi:hypothetical protein
MILTFSITIEKHLIKKTRKLILSPEGKELEEEFEIICFGSRAALIEWAYAHYLDILEYDLKHYANYDSSHYVNMQFLFHLWRESDKWYGSPCKTKMKLYLPYYYQTTIIPILKRFHKQKAFL